MTLTLDYVWVSDEWRVAAADPLPPAAAAEALPNRTWPSDHLLLAVELALPPTSAPPPPTAHRTAHRLRERPLEPGRWAFEGATGAAAAEAALETSLAELQRLCAALAFDQTRGCRCPSLSPSRAQTC